MTTHRVGVIGGDGIGPEVVAEALKVVRATGVALETTDYDIGFDRAVRDGVVLPDDMLDELRSQDAILFGAVGGPPTSTALAPGLIERGIILKLRFELDQFVNLRPFFNTAKGLDFVVVREGTEGVYAGEGGFLRKGTPDEIATQGS